MYTYNKTLLPSSIEESRSFSPDVHINNLFVIFFLYTQNDYNITNNS